MPTLGAIAQSDAHVDLLSVTLVGGCNDFSSTTVHLQLAPDHPAYRHIGVHPLPTYLEATFAFAIKKGWWVLGGRWRIAYYRQENFPTLGTRASGPGALRVTLSPAKLDRIEFIADPSQDGAAIAHRPMSDLLEPLTGGQVNLLAFLTLAEAAKISLEASELCSACEASTDELYQLTDHGTVPVALVEPGLNRHQPHRAHPWLTGTGMDAAEQAINTFPGLVGKWEAFKASRPDL